MALKMQSGGAPGASPSPIEATDSPKKKSMLPIIIGLVLLIAIGGGAAFFFMHKHHAPAKPAVEVVKVGEIVPLDEFMLNLADASNDHYLKVTVALGLKEGVSADKFKDKVPQARDAIVLVLSVKHLADVRTLAGKIQLKKEIQDSVNLAVGEKDVAAVYFQAFATQ